MEERIERLEHDFATSTQQIARSLSEQEGTLYDHRAILSAQGRDLREMRRDMAASFQQVAQQFEQVRHNMDARFEQVEENRAAMETRILDAFNQLLVILDERLPPKQES